MIKNPAWSDLVGGIQVRARRGKKHVLRQGAAAFKPKWGGIQVRTSGSRAKLHIGNKQCFQVWWGYRCI